MGYGLEAVGGAAARGGSDGRDVDGGGCTPLSARATATKNHPWSIHGGFIRQVHRVYLVHITCRFVRSLFLDDAISLNILHCEINYHDRQIGNRTDEKNRIDD